MPINPGRLCFLTLASLALAGTGHGWAASCAPGIPCVDPYQAGSGANDSKTDSKTCDGDFMNQIQSRAYMEASRQYIAAQARVRKPDSVLQYSCFDQFTSVAAVEIGKIFSDSKDWHNIVVNISGGGFGGFLGQSFMDALSGFAENLISDIIGNLLPEDFTNLLSQLDNLANLDADQLVHALGDLASDELEGAIGNLSQKAQNEIKKKILDAVPQDVLKMVSANPGAASPQELMIGLQNLPADAIADIMPKLNTKELGSLLNSLPSETLNKLPSKAKDVLKGLSPSQLGDVLEQLSPEALGALPTGALSDVIGDLTPLERSNLFKGMDGTAVAAAFNNMSSFDIDKVLNGMSKGAQDAIKNEIMAALPADMMNMMGDFGSLEDLLGGIQNFDMSQLSSMVPDLSMGDFSSMLNGLGSNMLGSLMDSGGGSTRIPVNVFMGDDFLDKSLEKVVLSTLKNYTSSNFSQSFLAGSAGVNFSINFKIGGGKYNCTTMQDVWQIAKCENFAARPEEGFQTFNQLAQSDPRKFPQACGGTMITQQMIDAAFNKGNKYVKYDQFKKTYIDRLDAPKDGGACGPARATGKMLTDKTYTYDSQGNIQTKTVQYEEKTCSNTGCVYDHKSDKCVTK